MARSFLTAINLNKNELQNAAVQNLAAAPATPVKGQLYFNSTGGDNTLYWWDGTTWVPAKATGGAFPGYGSVPAETTFGIAKADGAATTVARSDHTHGSPTHDAAAHSTIPINSLATATGPINMGGFTIQGVGTPVNPTDAANKSYVDNSIAGLSWKDSVRVATTANNGLSGLAAIDGVTPVVGDRVLVKNQTAPAENGIYTAATLTWVRATDADAAAEILAAAVYVEEGTTQGDTAWVMTTNAPITLGVTGLAWVQFGAGFTLLDDSVTNAKLANMPTYTVKANLTGSTADPTDATISALSSALVTQVVPPMARVFYSTTVGGATSQTINHNLAKNGVLVNVIRNSAPFDTVDCDVERPNGNQVTLRFAVAPAANEYQIVVVG